MQNTREKIQEFIENHFSEELTHISHLSKDMEPRLKYHIIDRYCMNDFTDENLRRLQTKVNRLPDVELYICNSYLNIAYSDPLLGIGHNCMKLDDFVSRSLQACSCQADKDFVRAAGRSCSCQVDKPQGVKQ